MLLEPNSGPYNILQVDWHASPDHIMGDAVSGIYVVPSTRVWCGKYSSTLRSSTLVASAAGK